MLNGESRNLANRARARSPSVEEPVYSVAVASTRTTKKKFDGREIAALTGIAEESLCCAAALWRVKYCSVACNTTLC
jgi:hypothetical protein